MKQKLLLLAFTLLSTMLFSQSRQYAFLDWTTISGTQDFFLKSITKTDAFGNVYVAGATINGSGNYDILLAKYNSSGNQLWIQQYAGAANGHDAAVSLMVTDTYAVLTGAVCNNTLVPESDIITIKYSSAGVLQWASTYNGTGSGIDIGTVVDRDGSGNIYVTGTSYNASFNSDYVTLKYNSSGTQQWVNRYDYSSGLDDAPVVLNTAGANIIVAGAVTHTTNTYKVASIFLSPSTGSITATNIGTVTTTSSLTAVTDLVNDYAGGSIFVGATTVSGQGDNFYVQKINNTLATVWTYTFNGTDNLDDVIKAVAVDASNNVYITGYTKTSTQGRDIVTMKLNSSGALQWTKYYNDTINGDDEAMDMIVDANNDIYITGYGTNTLNNTDYYTIKYNSSGTKIWEIESDGNSTNDVATNMTLDSLNNVIVTGQVELSPGTYAYATARYVQRDVITPTDFNGESPSNNFMYYQNKGQIVDTNYAAVTDVRFYTNNTYPSFYFKNNSSSFVFSRIDTVAATADTLHRIDLTFDNVRNASKTYPMEQQKTGYLNYFLGHLDSTGVTGVMGNARLVTPNIFPDIDLMYSSNQNGIKYYFIVKPGGDPTDIQMTFTGASSFSLNGTTNALSINSSIGSLTFDRPTAYQLTAGNATVAVTGWTPDWQTNGAANKYKFNTGAYTASLTLVIQVDQGNAVSPPVTTGPNIEWSTNFGSSGYEGVSDMKIGSANNLFLIGQNSTAVLPQATGITSFNIFQLTNNGLLDGYVAKFDQTGILQWRTYVGGSGHDQLRGFDIAGNGSGDVYCVGTTQSAVLGVRSKAGTTVNHATHASAGANKDGFIFQLNQNGNTCSWLTYYGGSGEDILANCKFDDNGHLFIIGASSSNNLAVVGTAPQYTCSYLDNNSKSDAYVMKLNNATFNIDWATYVASTSTLTGNCSGDFLGVLDFDASDNLFVGGYSTGANYPVLYSAGSTTIAGTTNCLGDGVVTQFSNSGEILWSTYIPSNGIDAVQALIVDVRDLYVGGYTNSTTTFPTLFSGQFYANTTKSVTPTGPYQESGFFVSFDNLNHGVHSTLIGGDDGDDQITDIAIDAVHNIYLVGWTSSTSLDQPSGGNPVNSWSETNKGQHDEFIFAIEKGSTDVIWSTQVGGDNQDDVSRVAIDGNNKLFLAGSMSSTINFPWHDGGGFPVHFQGALTGGQNDIDGCITRFKLSDINYVGVNEYNSIAQGVFVYPNPTQGLLTIKLPDAEQKKNFTIFNTMGQAVLSGTLLSQLTTINVSHIAEGMYFIEISDKTQKITAKFIKQ